MEQPWLGSNQDGFCSPGVLTGGLGREPTRLPRGVLIFVDDVLLERFVRNAAHQETPQPGVSTGGVPGIKPGST